MSKANHRSTLVKIMGPDVSGVTLGLMKALSDAKVPLEDVEQVVVQGQLVLCAVLGADGESEQGRKALGSISALGMEKGLNVSFHVLDSSENPNLGFSRYALTLIGEDLDAGGLFGVTKVLADHAANIVRIHPLSSKPVDAIELSVTIPSTSCAKTLKRDLVKSVQAFDLDIAVQRENLMRRSKRLVVMDMDSTLVQMETIDELARLHGVMDKVSAITERAMRGELNFEESLRERCALIAGLSFEKAMKVTENMPITHGAKQMLCVLRTLGYKTAVISGGFTFAANALKEKLSLDYAYANELEVKDGVFTGKVFEPILGAQQKADFLETLAKKEGASLEQTIAIGDGANDLLMLEKAGLGIAFHAKPRVKEEADTSVSAGGLDRILYLLGMHQREVRDMLQNPNCYPDE